MFRHFFAVPVFALAATALSASPTRPLANLVDDQTLMVLTVSDVPSLLRGWDASPVATTWRDPQIVRFLAPLREYMQIEAWDTKAQAATGLSVRELLGLVDGEALFALPSFDLKTFDANNPTQFLLALEVGQSAEKIKQLLAAEADKNSEKEDVETFAGVAVHIHTIGASREATLEDEAVAAKTVVWAMVDGVWLLSMSKERVFAAIDAVQQGGVATALGRSERFQRTRQRVGEAQALAYLNIPALYPLVRERVVASKANAKPNMLGVDAEAVFNAMGLDVLGEGYMAVYFDTQQTRMDAGLAYTEERGLLSLLTYEPGPMSMPDWVPAKWANVGVARFSVPKAYAGIESIVNAISPMLFGMAQGQLNSFDKKLGIDLRRDLIGSLGVDVVSAYATPPSQAPGSVTAWTQMDQLFAISLVNPEAFLRSVEALKRLAGPAADQLFTERDYLGKMIYTFNPPETSAKPTGRGFSYAIAHGTLLVGVGSPATVENALQGMAAGSGGFWQRADVKAALLDQPADAVGVQVQDMRVLLAALVETVVTYQQSLNAAESDKDRKTYVDVDARPDAEVWARHWGLSTSYTTRTAEGLFTSSRMVYPQQ